jgi:hypothetical protein
MDYAELVWVDTEGKGEEGGDGHDHCGKEEGNDPGTPPPGMTCLSLY